MKKKILIGILVALVIIIAGFIVFLKRPCNTSNIDTAGIILFYGSGCPHCAKVEQYIKDNNMKDKVQFTQREVFLNKCNAKLLGQLVAKCGLSTDEIGVPLLWNGANSTCASGDQDVINFFKSKIGG